MGESDPQTPGMPPMGRGGAWTIVRNDGDSIDVVPVSGRFTAEGGWRDQTLNGSYPSKLSALEAAEKHARDELLNARSRVKKLRARVRYERRKHSPAVE